MRGYMIVHDKVRHRDRDIKYGKVTIISSGPRTQPRHRSALAGASLGREPPGERHHRDTRPRPPPQPFL